MPISVEGSASPAVTSRSVHEKRNSPHPSKDFLHYKAPNQYNQSNKDRFQRDISESFYQDYTGGRMGGIGAGISTKGWGTYHGRDWYMGNALCNLAHDPAAPHGVEKSELLRSISRTYSRSLPRSRSASGTRERIWSTNILEDSKKAASRPRSQSAKSLSKRGEPSREIAGDVKRFLDSRTAEERGQIYKYLQDTAKASRDDEVEKVTDDEAKTKSPKKPSGAKKEGNKEAAKGSEHSDADKKKQEVRDAVSSPRRHKYSDKYKRQRVNKAQSATGTIFSVSGARQPAHYAIFPDWPSEKDSKK